MVAKHTRLIQQCESSELTTQKSTFANQSVPDAPNQPQLSYFPHDIIFSTKHWSADFLVLLMYSRCSKDTMLDYRAARHMLPAMRCFAVEVTLL